MKIAVCVKQIPDPASDYELDPQTHNLIRPEAQILDDTDRYGVEVGLQIADANGGEVYLVSMSPSGTLQGIRQALAMGVDKAVIIDDEALAGSDSLTTARALAAAITKEGYDIVIAGTESTDGYSGLVPQQVAGLLGVPALTYATSVEYADGVVRIHRQTADGYDEVEAATPVVVSVTAGVVEPRYPNFKGIMQAKSKPVDTHTAADLGVDPSVGQKIVSISPAPARASGTVVEDEGEAYLDIIKALEEAKVL
jgi:electron transfer flavoprotein beta subunit